jgi:fibronectin-binding autotransporter adhesin
VLVFEGNNKLTINTNNITGGSFWSIVFAGGAGAFTLNGNALTLSNGITNNSANTQTFNLSGITLGGAQTFHALSNNLVFSSLNNITNAGFLLSIDGAFNTTFSSIISGSGGLTKNGTGTLALNAANTYTGTTTINGGILALGNAGALGGNGSLTFGGGTLRYSAANTADLSSRITGSTGAISIDTAGQNVTFASALAGSNTGGLTKSGAGTLTLSGASAYAGATTIAGGTLSLGADNNLGVAPGSATAGSLALADGTLLFTAGFTLNANRGIALGAGGGTFNVASGQAVSYAGSIAGAGGFTKTGAGALTLSGPSSYTGVTTVSAGTLRATDASAFGASVATNALTLNGGRLELASDTATVFGPDTGYRAAVGGAVTIALDRLTSGAGVVQQLGTLSLGAQTLTLEKGGNVTSGTATLAISGTTTLNGNATFATGAGTELSLDGGLSGTFNLTKTGDGVLTLNRGGSQVDTTVTAGQLNINWFTALGLPAQGTLTLGDGVTIDNTSGQFVQDATAKAISLGSTLNFLGSSDLSLGNGLTTLTNNTAINVAAGTLIFGGDITGAFGLTKNGAGTLQLAGLSGTNSFTGNSFINGGELFLSGASVFGGTTNTTVTIADDAFLRVGAGASVGQVTLSLMNPGSLILETAITNDVVFAESGTLTSTFANVDGSLTIDSGVTMSTAANYLGTVPTTNTPRRIVLQNNATLAATASFTIEETQGITLESGTATLSSGNAVQMLIASSISGEGGLRKTGPGNVRLTGTNSYTGGTVIDQGIIGITSDASLGAVSGRLKLNNGTLVAAQNNTGGATNNGTVVNADRVIVLGNGTVNNIDAQNGLFFEYNGVIGEENSEGAAASMRYGFVSTRQGTVRLGGLNTYNGSTTLVGGVLEVATIADGGQASGIGQSGNAAENLVLDSGTLRFTGASAGTDRLFTVAGPVVTIDSGAGSLAFTNSGSLLIASTNSSHQITLDGSGTGELAAAIGDAGGNSATLLAKNGAGIWSLSGLGTYTGGTFLNEGILRLLGTTAAGLGLITQSNVFSTLVIDTTGTVANAMNIYNLRTMQTVTLSGNKTLFNASYTVDPDTITTDSGNLSGDGGVTKLGTGTLILTGNNTYTGAVDVQEGLLELASTTGAAAGATVSVSVSSGAILLVSQSNQVNDSATVSLSGGTITRGGGVSEVFGNLNIEGGSILDFGTGAVGDLRFQTYTYTGSSLIAVRNFLPGNRLQFLGSSFTSDNLAEFDFGDFGFASGLEGDYFTITAIPEPSTYLAAAGLLAVMLWPSRRRLLRCLKSTFGGRLAVSRG